MLTGNGSAHSQEWLCHATGIHRGGRASEWGEGIRVRGRRTASVRGEDSSRKDRAMEKRLAEPRGGNNALQRTARSGCATQQE